MAYPYVLEIPAFYSNDAAFKGDLRSLSFATGGPTIGNPNTGTGGTKITEMNLTRKSDEASALFLSHAAHGTRFPKITITGFKQSGNSEGKVAYYIFTLDDAVITSFHMGGSGGDPDQFDSISFTCREITGKAL